MQATFRTILRRRGGFIVTPKQGESARQPRAVLPALVTVAVLAGVAVYGLVKDRSPSTLNNIAFATLHISVLLAGAWPALRGGETAAIATDEPLVRERAPAIPADRQAA